MIHVCGGVVIRHLVLTRFADVCMCVYVCVMRLGMVRGLMCVVSLTYCICACSFLAYVHTCIHSYIHTSRRRNAYTCTHVHTYIRTHVGTYTHTHKYTRTYM